MPQQWRESKEVWAKIILEDIKGKQPVSVLSVGAGVGYMESFILKQYPDVDMHCTDVTDKHLQWLAAYLPKENMHIGYVPQCLPADLTFDYIYCAAMDCVMTDRDWITFLHSLCNSLKPDGILLILTASLVMPWSGNNRFLGRVRYYKNQIKGASRHVLGIEKQQFWGYCRTEEENINLLRKAGYSLLSNGPLGNNPTCMYFKAQA